MEAAAAAATRKRAYRRLYDETLPQLYEISCNPTYILRRPCRSSSLTRGESAFILFDISSRCAWVWSSGAGITCQNLAYSLAKETVRDEYKEWKGGIFRIGDDSREPEGTQNETAFWALIKRSPNTSSDRPATPTPTKPPLRLIQLQWDNNSSGTISQSLLAEANQFDGKVLLDGTSRDAALYLDAGGGELYLYLGPGITDQAYKDAAMAFAEQQREKQSEKLGEPAILTLLEPPSPPPTSGSGNAMENRDALADQKVVLWQQRFTQYAAISSMTSPPGSPCRSPVTSTPRVPIIERLGEGRQLSLYRIMRYTIKRIPLAASSLRKGDAVLLVNTSEREVILWSGASCGVFLKNKAKMIGQEVSHDELHQFKDAFFELRQGRMTGRGSSEEAACERFWKALGASYPAAEDSISENPCNEEEDTKPVSLSRFQAGEGAWELISQSRQFDSALLREDQASIYLMDCGGGEIYLHVGEKASLLEKECAVEAALSIMRAELQANSGPLLTILSPRPGKGMGAEKCVLWHQRWTQFGTKTADQVGMGAGTSHEVSTSPKGKVREVRGEIERMLTDNVGSLRMLANLVDDAMSGHALPLALLDDSSLEVTGWRVSTASEIGGRQSVSPRGSKAVAEFSPVPEEELGIFVRGEAMVLNVSLKRGARRMLYLWIGDGAPEGHKAFLSLNATRLDPRADQINIEEGREPPFLRMMLASIGRPLIVLRTRAGAVSRDSARLFAVEESSLFPGRGSVAIVEQDATAAVSFGLAPHKCYVLLAPQRGEVFLWPGAETSEETQMAAVDAARPWGRLVAACSLSPGSGLKLILETKQRTVIDAIKSEFPACAPTRFLSANETSTYLRSKMRPRRLFLVSQETRNTGAMFIREMGAGDVFNRHDLTKKDALILDAGKDYLYVWLGAQASQGTRDLAAEVAQSYIDRLRERDPEYVAERLLGAGLPSKAIIMESGAEVSEFVWSFKGWRLESSLFSDGSQGDIGEIGEVATTPVSSPGGSRYDRYGELIKPQQPIRLAFSETQKNGEDTAHSPGAGSTESDVGIRKPAWALKTVRATAYDENGEPIRN